MKNTSVLNMSFLLFLLFNVDNFTWQYLKWLREYLTVIKLLLSLRAIILPPPQKSISKPLNKIQFPWRGTDMYYYIFSLQLFVDDSSKLTIPLFCWKSVTGFSWVNEPPFLMITILFELAFFHLFGIFPDYEDLL